MPDRRLVEPFGGPAGWKPAMRLIGNLRDELERRGCNWPQQAWQRGTKNSRGRI
jgi:hypothetical protein